jgi:hypothetical protein
MKMLPSPPPGGQRQRRYHEVAGALDDQSAVEGHRDAAPRLVGHVHVGLRNRRDRQQHRPDGGQAPVE